MSKINSGGYLTSLAEKVMSGGLDSKQKLRSGDLMRIATILGYLSKDYDLYSLLFEEPNKRIKVDGVEINTKDLMWFVIMDHSYARGWYWQPDGTMVTDTSVCVGVPLVFLGAKRVYNKTYSSWLEDYEEMKLDMFLPQGLNCWKINDKGEQVLEESNAQRGGDIGLIRLYKSEYKFEIDHIHRIREQITLGSPKPRKVKDIAEEDTYDKLFNRCSFVLRCMIAQTWCWGSVSRNSDMITDYKNWDNLQPSVESASLAMQGLVPKNTRIAPGFLAFTGTKEADLLNVEVEQNKDDLKI